MKKFSIALLVLALCLVSIAVSASGTLDATATYDGKVVTVNVTPGTATDVVIIAMRGNAAVEATTLASLASATEAIVFADQLDTTKGTTVSFIPKKDVAGSTITVFVGDGSTVVSKVLSVEGAGCYVGDSTITTDAAAGFYSGGAAAKEYAISVTADVNAGAFSSAITKYGFCIYNPANADSTTVAPQSAGALAANDSAFAVIATGIPEASAATEIFFKPYLILENGTTYWGAGRAFSVNGLGGTTNDLGTLANVNALAD